MCALGILVGGVPFGRNNAGDEAILECVVATLRQLRPDARIAVSTDDPATAARLGVETVPLFGFEPPYSRRQMVRCLAEADLFVWAGATGLSDYPEIPLEMLNIARRAGTRTAVWCVGMGERLNPAYYTLQPGLRRWLLAALSIGLFDLVAKVEALRTARTRRRIVDELRAADLVVLRDPESLRAVQACGYVPGALVGADPAILLDPAPFETVALEPAVQALLASDGQKIGVGISAQRPPSRLGELAELLDRLAGEGCGILFLPMNHATDAALMDDLRKEMRYGDRAAVLHGRRPPTELMAVAERLDVVVASRLHLLVLAASRHVPVVGIARGSKIDGFLAPYGLKPAGTAEECDFAFLESEIRRLLADRSGFGRTSRRVRTDMLKRMDAAQAKLARLLDDMD